MAVVAGAAWWGGAGGVAAAGGEAVGRGAADGRARDRCGARLGGAGAGRLPALEAAGGAVARGGLGVALRLAQGFLVRGVGGRLGSGLSRTRLRGRGRRRLWWAAQIWPRGAKRWWPGAWRARWARRAHWRRQGGLVVGGQAGRVAAGEAGAVGRCSSAGRAEAEQGGGREGQAEQSDWTHVQVPGTRADDSIGATAGKNRAG